MTFTVRRSRDGLVAHTRSWDALSFLCTFVGIGIYALLIDTAKVELSCFGGGCLLTHSSLAGHRGLFGHFRGILQLATSSSKTRFESALLQRAVVTERTSGGRHPRTVYKLNLELVGPQASMPGAPRGVILKDGLVGGKLKFFTYSSSTAAEDMALTIQGAIYHAQMLYDTKDAQHSIKSLPEDDYLDDIPRNLKKGIGKAYRRSEKLVSLYVREDLASWDEFLLFLAILGVFTVLTTMAHSETLVVNETVGVVVVERRTILSSLRTGFEHVLARACACCWACCCHDEDIGWMSDLGVFDEMYSGRESTNGHVALLVPADQVVGVETTVHVKRERTVLHGRGGRAVTYYGLQLRLLAPGGQQGGGGIARTRGSNGSDEENSRGDGNDGQFPLADLLTAPGTSNPISSSSSSSSSSDSNTNSGININLHRILTIRLGGIIRDRALNESHQAQIHSSLQAAKENLSPIRRFVATVQATAIISSGAGAGSGGADAALNAEDPSTSLTRAGGGGGRGGRCVVCLERPGCVAFAPCAHVCCCEVCGQNPALRTCPMCRRLISQRIGLYFS